MPVADMPPPPPADADGDDLPDAADKCPNDMETKNGYQDDDGCPDSVPAPLKQFSGVVKGINFKKGSAEIEKKSFKILDKSASALMSFPDLKVEVQGHTDDEGDDSSNLALSQARAESVRAYLIAKGVGGDRVLGVILIENHEREHAFGASEVRLLETVFFRSQATMITAREGAVKIAQHE